MNKLVVSQYQDKITSVLFCDNLPVEIRVEDTSSNLQVGDIYIGIIRDLPQGINGAFVEINKEICYYPLNEIQNAVYTRRLSSNSPVCGDEIIFQVQREAIKTKAVGLTTRLSLAGQYLVYEPSSERNSISSKINEPVRGNIKKLFDEFPDKGYIIRTCAASASTDDIIKEAFYLKDKYDNIIRISKSNPRGTCLYRASSSYIELLEHSGGIKPDLLITDLPKVFEEVNDHINNNGIRIRTELYNDKKLKLMSLYNFDRIITGCYHERVWLKSGGYLVIQHTEALTVIDVNSGKASDSMRSDLLKKINMEAAEAIPYELRLRNISGIILVDFINLEHAADLKDVCICLETELKQDPVSAKYIDTTSLQLVEIVREKKRKPIREYYTSNND